MRADPLEALGSCSVSRTCSEDNFASCSCTNAGCTSSCGSTPPEHDLPNKPTEGVSIVGDPTRLESLVMVRATLKGFKDHIERSLRPWRVILAVQSSERLNLSFEDVSIEEIVSTVARQARVCGKVDRSAWTISFLPEPSCR